MFVFGKANVANLLTQKFGIGLNALVWNKQSERVVCLCTIRDLLPEYNNS